MVGIMATKKKVSKKNELTKEDKIIMKLSNKWEFLGYAFKYRLSKFVMFIIIIILIGVILKLSGFDFKNLQSIFKGTGL